MRTLKNPMYQASGHNRPAGLPTPPLPPEERELRSMPRKRMELSPRPKGPQGGVPQDVIDFFRKKQAERKAAQGMRMYQASGASPTPYGEVPGAGKQYVAPSFDWAMDDPETLKRMFYKTGLREIGGDAQINPYMKARRYEDRLDRKGQTGFFMLPGYDEEAGKNTTYVGYYTPEGEYGALPLNEVQNKFTTHTEGETGFDVLRAMELTDDIIPKAPAHQNPDGGFYVMPDNMSFDFERRHEAFGLPSDMTMFDFMEKAGVARRPTIEDKQGGGMR